MADAAGTIARLGDGLTQTVASADPDIWKAIFIAGAIAVAGFWLFASALRRSRSIGAIPRSLLRSAAQGYVELHGTTMQLPDLPVTAPLSGRSCVWFSFSVERRSRDSKGNVRWNTIDSGRSEDRFELRDETGHCVVDPRGAEVVTGTRDRWFGNAPTPPHGPEAQPRGWRSGEYRYTEQRLAEKATLFVWGNFRTTSLRPGIDERVNELLRSWKADQATLISRFDANRDGNVDGAEWEAARRSASAEVSAAPPVGIGTLNVVDRPAEGDRPFILSTQSEATLMRGYRIQTWTGIAMFLLGGAACVWMVGARLAA